MSDLPIAHRITVNADGSVDGEFRIEAIPRGITIEQLASRMAQEIPPTPFTWVRMVLGYKTPEPGKGGAPGETSSDRRYKGVSQAWTGFYRNTRYRKPRLQMAAGEIDENLARKKRNKPIWVAWRIHWNAANTKPANWNKLKHAKRFKRKHN